MAQQHFGSRLAEARKRLGLSLDKVHAQLRITPAILDSLERSDFRRMPLKGHARNMISAYARFLGLDPTDITKQFLKEYHEFENHMQRAGNLPDGGSAYRNNGNSSSGNIENRPSNARYANTAASQGVNSMWNKSIPRSALDNYGAGQGVPQARRTVQPGVASSADQTGDLGGYQGGYQGSYQSSYQGAGNRAGYQDGAGSRAAGVGLTGRAGHTRSTGSMYGGGGGRNTSTVARKRVQGNEAATTDNYRSNVYGADNRGSQLSYSSGSYNARPSLPFRLFGSLFNNPIALVVVLIVVLVLLFAIWAIAANSCKAKEDDALTTTPVGAVVSSEDGGAATGTETPAQTTPQDNSFELVVRPAAGSGPYTEVTVDGQVVFAEQALTAEQKWTVTQSCIVKTWQMENVTVTKNGEAVALAADGTGAASVEIKAEQAAGTTGTTGTTTGTGTGTANTTTQ